MLFCFPVLNMGKYSRNRLGRSITTTYSDLGQQRGIHEIDT